MVDQALATTTDLWDAIQINQTTSLSSKTCEWCLFHGSVWSPLCSHRRVKIISRRGHDFWSAWKIVRHKLLSGELWDGRFIGQCLCHGHRAHPLTWLLVLRHTMAHFTALSLVSWTCWNSLLSDLFTSDQHIAPSSLAASSKTEIQQPPRH